MTHHGNTGTDDSFDRLTDFFAAFQFHCICSRLLHDTDGRVQRLLRVTLIGAEREVHHHQGTVDGAHHGGSMVYHRIQSDGKGGLITRHHIGGGVAHKDNVDFGAVQKACHRIVVVQQRSKGVVVSSQHSDFLTLVAHFLEDVRGDFVYISIQVIRHSDIYSNVFSIKYLSLLGSIPEINSPRNPAKNS